MSEVLWPAPRALTPIRATVTVPGSKSATNRALAIAALGNGTSTVISPLRCDDTEAMKDGISALGAVVLPAGDDLTVTGALPGPTAPVTIDARQSGTTARFLPAIAALTTAAVRIDGSEQLRARPMAPLLGALRHIGADIHDRAGGLPITVNGHGRVRGGAVRIDASDSSQFISGLLIAACRFDLGVAVTHSGITLPSRPHIDMTCHMLRTAGISVEASDHSWRVHPGIPRAGKITIEPDLSAAAVFLAAAAVTHGAVTISGWPASTAQPGAAILPVLRQFGATTHRSSSGMIVTGHDLHGIDADLSDCGELAPVIAAMAALADTPSRLRGIGHLRGHETDRLAALAAELNKLGGRVTVLPDGLAVEPAFLHGGVFETYGDHRMAMAGALLGLVVDQIQVVDIATTGKTLPSFVDLWIGMLDGSAA